MQNTANAIPFFSRLSAMFRSAMTARSSAESFYIMVPGSGSTGNFSTIADAERALARMPYSVRRDATICDQDGHCLSR